MAAQRRSVRRSVESKDRRRRIQTIQCVQEKESFYAHTNERKDRRRRIQSTQDTMQHGGSLKRLNMIGAYV